MSLYREMLLEDEVQQLRKELAEVREELRKAESTILSQTYDLTELTCKNISLRSQISCYEVKNMKKGDWSL